ncbi:MAG TPA: hypothetical protein VHB79_29005 [Polyangiaceae bacterium]|nr:hypothetical protein [Polyangiaceae bacterium]
MRSIWNLPLVTSLTPSAHDDAAKRKAAPGAKPDIHAHPLGGGSGLRQSGRGGGRGAPDVKRVHSFANRRRNK